MNFRLSGITIDCIDPVRVAQFWQALLGGETSVPLPDWQRLSTTPALNFQPVPEPKHGKSRVHLDFTVPEIDEAVTAIERNGGRFTGERHDYDEGIVCVMADPEGHEFCIVQYL